MNEYIQNIAKNRKTKSKNKFKNKGKRLFKGDIDVIQVIKTIYIYKYK